MRAYMGDCFTITSVLAIVPIGEISLPLGFQYIEGSLQLSALFELVDALFLTIAP